MESNPLRFLLYQEIYPAVSSPVPPRPAESPQVRAPQPPHIHTFDLLDALAETLKSGCIPVRPCQYPDVRAPMEHPEIIGWGAVSLAALSHIRFAP